MNLELKLVELQQELCDAKLELSHFTQEQKHKQVMTELKKIECHTKAQMNLMKIQVKLMLVNTHIQNKNRVITEDHFKELQNELDSIVD